VIGMVHFLLQNEPGPRGAPFGVPQGGGWPWACPALFALLSEQCDVSAGE